MPRLTFGPSQGSVVVSPTDVEVDIVSAVGPTVTLSIPSYDPATQALPDYLHVAYLPSAPPAGEAPSECLSTAAHQGKVGVAGHGTSAVNVAGLPPGTYFVQVIPEFTV